MPRRKKPTKVSDELDVKTKIEITTKKRDQSAYTRIPCPACDFAGAPTPLVAIPERTTPGSGAYACTVCDMIIQITVLTNTRLHHMKD